MRLFSTYTNGGPGVQGNYRWQSIKLFFPLSRHKCILPMVTVGKARCLMKQKVGFNQGSGPNLPSSQERGGDLRQKEPTLLGCWVFVFGAAKMAGSVWCPRVNPAPNQVPSRGPERGPAFGSSQGKKSLLAATPLKHRAGGKSAGGEMKDRGSKLFLKGHVKTGSNFTCDMRFSLFFPGDL